MPTNVHHSTQATATGGRDGQSATNATRNNLDVKLTLA